MNTMKPDMILKLRLSMNMTQSQFAEELCVHKMTVWRWENSSGKPDLYRNNALWELYDEQQEARGSNH